MLKYHESGGINDGFNASHAYSVALDSVYGAYLKANYPLDYYAVILNLYEGNTTQTAKIVRELDHFGITLGNIEFGKSRSEYTADKDTRSIYKGMKSIKRMNAETANKLYDLYQEKQYKADEFVEFVIDAFEEAISPSQLEILTKLNFFSMFAGDRSILLEVLMCASDRKKADEKYVDFSPASKKPLKYSRTHKQNTKDTRIENIKAYYKAVLSDPPSPSSVYQQVAFEKDSLGYGVTKYPELSDSIYIVMDINKRYTPRITMYRVCDGFETSFKISKKKFYTKDDQMLYEGDVIDITEIEEKYAWMMVDGKWQKNKDRVEEWVEKCKILRREEDYE